ncbi:FtsK/SpoIIIE family DNA translocase [Alistipes indistinctus]|jgi:S-DNA-T family DNA segregation ATPase FtsK/SpoIIIE|uniref:FtsK/SpoIIIE family DNA translocase n=1 Tax=Alistipes indistinctus TaxID=626932 RepID=UPI000E47ED39|nr:DNA translocase FtsK [Alistipes indistinctus]KAA3142164.1 DNA translocase FtsK [Alistipes indistinctus]RGU36296.1 DNA translocase FtsK [Alistipes indistinctus]
MATAAKKKPAAAEGRQPRQQGLSDTQRWSYGFALLAVALFILVSVVSYFIYWSKDQAVARFGQVFDATQDPVSNWGGKLGAVTANYIVGEWFGLFGICIPIVLIVLSLRIMRYRPMLLRKSVRLMLVLMILGSLALGYIFGDAWGVFGTGLGGAHGIYVARWLNSLIGVLGTGLLLALAFVIYAVYINRNTIGVINRLGKGMVDNSKKLGEVITSTAADLLPHDSRKEGDESFDNVVGADVSAGKNGTKQTGEGESAGASASCPGSPLAPSGGQPGVITDEEGFSVIIPGASVPNTVGEDFYDQVPRVAEQTDEDGFVIIKPVEEPDSNVQPLQPVTRVDENGFEITGLPVENSDASAAGLTGTFGTGSDAQISGSGMSVTAADGSSGAFEKVDENGFTIQYAAGDGEPEQPAGVSAGGWPDAPAAGAMPGDYPVRRNDGTDNPFKADPVPPFAETADSPSGVASGNVPSAGGADFVAAVPQDTAIESSADMTVDRLPGDKILSEEEIENALYDPTLDLSSYQRPPLELLEDHTVEVSVTSEEIVENKNRIKETLENFGIKIDKVKATIGPTVTLYEIVPAPGVRISKIKNLEDDIALSLSALGIRIIAPIPGKGTIGIEVPNKDKKVVSMFSVIKSAKFQESTYDIPVVLGKTIQDETFVIDLAKMPHLLVAGATGQGKSVGLNAIITSLLYKKHPSELKLVLVDPKKVELTLYGKLERHFLAKLPGEDDAIITDTHKVIYTLNSLCIEMDARYDLLRKAEVRHVKEYNDKFRHRKLNPQKGHRFLPYIIVVIDEFADLIMTAGREVETPIARIAQLARAVGIHLVIATQRPTTNIITGVIKANFPARIAFRVTSMIDSRTIIDQPGANQLIGRGDMLVSTGNDLTRVQCAFVDTPEIERITEFISNQRGYLGAYELPEYNPDSADNGGSAGGNRANDLSQLDAMFDEVAHFVVQNQQGSTSSIQRRFSIGYNRAGRIMDQLEMAGVVGRAEGSKPREVLIQDVMSLEHLLAHMND